MEIAVAGFAVSPPHNVQDSPPLQLLPALLAAEFVFVCEDSSTPSLAPLYRGPYLILERKDKYFHLNLGSRTDVVSVDRLKPAFSEDPIQAALPPARGRPALRTALGAPDPPPSSPFLLEVLLGKVSDSSFRLLYLLDGTRHFSPFLLLDSSTLKSLRINKRKCSRTFFL